MKTRKLSYVGHVLSQEKLGIEQTVITGLTPETRTRLEGDQQQSGSITLLNGRTRLNSSGSISTVRDRNSWRYNINHCGQNIHREEDLDTDRDN